MPELPEVETVRLVLERRVLGRRIESVEIRDPRLREPVAPDFAGLLTGRRIAALYRRAKYLLTALDDGHTWVTHLGMTGKLIVVDPARPRDRHDHVVLRLEGGLELRYHDPRRFGLLAVLSPTQLAAWPSLVSLGPDPLVEGVDPTRLLARARATRRTIKDLLMDQSVVGGLGNIYVNEALFRAGVRPGRRANRIGSNAVTRLAEAIPPLVREAVRWCGTSFSDYRDAEDRPGEFQDHLAVYGRDGSPCRACGATVRRVTHGNRSSFYCPVCQR